MLNLSSSALWPRVSLLGIAALAATGACSFANEIDPKGMRLQVAKLRSVATKDSPTGIAWSPDGNKIAVIHNFGGTISVWSSAGESITSIKRDVTTGPYVGSSLVFMSDSRTILAPAPTPIHKEYSSLGLWDAQTGVLQGVIPQPSSERAFQAVVARIFALSPDGSLVALRPINNQEPISIYRTGDWSLLKTKQIWRSETLGLKPFYRSAVPGITPPIIMAPSDFREVVTALAFAPNNDLAVGLTSGLVILESAPSSTGQRFFESADKPISCMAYSPNGQFIATGIDTSMASKLEARPAFLQIREVASGNIVVEDNTVGEVKHLAWDRDGDILAVITVDDVLHLYRPFTNGRVHQDVPVSKGSFRLSFSPIKSELAVSTPAGADFYSIRLAAEAGMSRAGWILLLSAAITAVIARCSLWMRGLRPSSRVGLWESMTWQMFPKDEQTRVYVQQGLLTTIVVLPITLLVLTVLSKLYGQ